MQKILGLHPHKHTGKVLHHKHTSYRALLLIMLVAGVFMIGMSSMVKADDYDVTATVPAPIPPDAPVITGPATYSSLGSPNAVVVGSCPVITPSVIIVIRENTTTLGSGECSASGAFDVPVTLQFAISHTVTATVETITGQTGQTSQPFTINYQAPPLAPSPTSPPSTSKPPRSPATPQPQADGLRIVANKPFVVFGSRSDAVWTGSFTGGKTPYRVVVDWGDGEVQRYAGVKYEQQIYSHRYDKLRPHKVTVTVTDSSGASVSQTFAAVTPLLFDDGVGGLGTQERIRISVPVLLYALYFALLAYLAALWRRHHRTVRPIRTRTHLGKPHYR